ncbi:DUF885 domain-containing protein [Arenimonas donghaensis]|nr:DUF885 domain-containing protein [Arenimonas donghaensis]
MSLPAAILQCRASAAWLLCLLLAGTAGAKNPDEPMRRLADDYLHAELARDPAQAYFVGLPAPRHDRLADRSPEALAAWRAREDQFLARLLAIDAATLHDRALARAHAQMREHLEASVQQRVCRREGWHLSHMDGWHLVMAEVASRQPVETASERAQALARLREMARYVAQEQANLATGLAAGYSVPRTVVERVIAQIEGYATDDPALSPLDSPAARSEDNTFRQAYRRRLQVEVVPALRRYRDFLSAQYLPRARTTLAVSALPDGERCYRALLRAATTLDVAPREIIERGERTVAGNLQTVSALGRQYFDQADLPLLVARLDADPDNRFQSAQELLAFSRELVARSETATRPLFRQWPRQAMQVLPLPEHEQGSGLSSHYDPEPDPGQPATYRLNLDRWQTDTRATAAITAVHEGWPGHHLQMAIAAGQGDQHPVSLLFYNPAYVEGWARYAEGLAEEAGLLDDPKARIARRIWPGRGMVVDPGIHAGGWTREQARDYLVASGRFDPVRAEAQIDRIAAIPGQLTSYDTGALEIAALRAEAEARQGADFDLAAFHEQVLDAGIVPLGELRRRLEAWISR